MEFREYLQAELVKRYKQNPRYSLRAFSKSLDVENSWLSKVLRGVKKPSRSTVETLGLKLGLTAAQVSSFYDGDKPKNSYQVLPEDVFEIISEWQHFAILELMKVRGFKQDEKWIAEKLGISFIEARQSIERLQKSGLLKAVKGKWVDTSKGFTTHNIGINFTSAARRRLQEKILDKSKEALISLPITERDHSSMMMATSTKKIAEAKRRIDKFRAELCEFLEEGSTKDAVFQLSVGLFPLTKK